MISFSHICVCVVIIVIVLISTGILGVIADSIIGDTFEFGGWLYASVGFGICLTILLYQNGVVK